MLDPIRTFARQPGRRYFVRGGVVPRGDGLSATDFGGGIYAWDDDAAGLERAIVWAGRRADYSLVPVTPCVTLLTVSDDAWDGLAQLALRTPDGFDADRWSQAVDWYRRRDAGAGPLDAYDLVSGPLATGGRHPWKPRLDLPDQYRFLPQVGHRLEVAAEVLDDALGR